ncbi:unnamed protein product [Adineta steineri]|uniref:MAM domain-containing protein n=1 Tax=Adineta steineri TaxID=433720 RepID=A0A819CA87_9BILA|nr:unnamed protein product [Adineta steineri]
MIYFMLIFVSSIQYNQRCTFSSGTCNWNIGRRWQIKNLDEETDDKVLIAVDASNEDKEKGFTDIVTSSWLYLTSSCLFIIRLTFQFSIENEQDQIEIFFINKDRTQISSIGRWKALTQKNIDLSDEIESLWQQANITFQASEEFRIEIEIRHLPDNRSTSTTWFAIDDILIENCPNMQTTTTYQTQQTITTESWTNYSNLNISNSSVFARSFFRFHWKFNDSISSSEDLLSSQSTFFTFVLYVLYALVAITLSIILLAIIIFTYRKYCLPSSKSSIPIINYRHHSNKKKKHNHLSIPHNSHIDQDARTEKTMVTTIRPSY